MLLKRRTVIVLAAAALATACYRQMEGVAEDYRKYEQITPGMSEGRVIELLGEPRRRYDKATAPTNYYVDGYQHKKRPITNKVLIYVKGDPICYVYIDNKGLVEDVFIGGS